MIFYVKEYKKFIPMEKELNYLLDAEMYLNHRFWDNMVEEINLNEDYIIVKFWREVPGTKDELESIKDKIVIKGDKLYVDFNYTGNKGNTLHVLIENIENFNLVEKENLFYIKLKVKNKEERIYCYEKV
ncbi:hypothetical protein ELS18_01535 [Clostridium perfringens]|nr:hypothetical protein ELS18_01535 [Clostridium perfringens]